MVLVGVFGQWKHAVGVSPMASFTITPCGGGQGRHGGEKSIQTIKSPKPRLAPRLAPFYAFRLCCGTAGEGLYSWKARVGGHVKAVLTRITRVVDTSLVCYRKILPLLHIFDSKYLFCPCSLAWCTRLVRNSRREFCPLNSIFTNAKTASVLLMSELKPAYYT